jgi:hypothetical protein
MKRGLTRREAARRRQARTGPVSSPQPDPGAESRALLDAGESRHPQADARGDGSIQDPLQDWPESTGEPDGWIAERQVRGEQPDR